MAHDVTLPAEFIQPAAPKQATSMLVRRSKASSQVSVDNRRGSLFKEPRELMHYRRIQK